MRSTFDRLSFYVRISYSASSSRFIYYDLVCDIWHRCVCAIRWIRSWNETSSGEYIVQRFTSFPMPTLLCAQCSFSLHICNIRIHTWNYGEINREGEWKKRKTQQDSTLFKQNLAFNSCLDCVRDNTGDVLAFSPPLLSVSLFFLFFPSLTPFGLLCAAQVGSKNWYSIISQRVATFSNNPSKPFSTLPTRCSLWIHSIFFYRCADGLELVYHADEKNWYLA